MSEAGETLIERAQLAQREHRLADARQNWLAAVDLIRVEDNGLQPAQALRTLAELERKLRDDQQARAHYEQAVALLHNCSEQLMFAHTVRHVGNVHHDAGRADLAAPCYDEALALYRGHPCPPPLDLANGISSMAVLKQEAGDRQRA